MMRQLKLSYEAVSIIESVSMDVHDETDETELSNSINNRVCPWTSMMRQMKPSYKTV